MLYRSAWNFARQFGHISDRSSPILGRLPQGWASFGRQQGAIWRDMLLADALVPLCIRNDGCKNCALFFMEQHCGWQSELTAVTPAVVPSYQPLHSPVSIPLPGRKSRLELIFCVHQGRFMLCYVSFMCFSFVFQVYVVLCLIIFGCAIDCLERHVSKMTYYVSSGTLNPTHCHWMSPIGWWGQRLCLVWGFHIWCPSLTLTMTVYICKRWWKMCLAGIRWRRTMERN